MRKKFKKLVGFTTAVAMAVSLVPTNVFAEEPEVAVAEESAKNDNLLRVWYDEPATDWQTQSLAIYILFHMQYALSPTFVDEPVLQRDGVLVLPFHASF